MMQTGRRWVSDLVGSAVVSLGVAVTIGVAGCGDDSGDGPACAEIDLQTCTTAFSPTWDDVYRHVIDVQCAASTCHGDGMAGGLKMSTKADAYAGLVDGVGGKPRVIKGDAACSILTERIETDDPDKRMPYKGAKLSAGDRCAIEKWIAAGAPK
jgi:Planctomycete cytochrome C